MEFPLQFLLHLLGIPIFRTHESRQSLLHFGGGTKTESPEWVYVSFTALLRYSSSATQFNNLECTAHRAAQLSPHSNFRTLMPKGKMSKEILFILTLDFLTVLLQIGSFCPEILASLLVPVALTPAFGREHYFQSGKKKKKKVIS